MSKSEREQVLADAAYWHELADVLGWRLVGFTYRFGATFSAQDGTVNLTGPQRDAIMRVLQDCSEGHPDG